MIYREQKLDSIVKFFLTGKMQDYNSLFNKSLGIKRKALEIGLFFSVKQILLQIKNGDTIRSRTGLRGFAGPCITDLPWRLMLDRVIGRDRERNIF